MLFLLLHICGNTILDFKCLDVVCVHCITVQINNALKSVLHFILTITFSYLYVGGCVRQIRLQHLFHFSKQQHRYILDIYIFFWLGYGFRLLRFWKYFCIGFLCLLHCFYEVARRGKKINFFLKVKCLPSDTYNKRLKESYLYPVW